MRILICACLSLFILSCTNKKEELTMVEQLYRNYEVEPSPDRAQIYLDSLEVMIASRSEERDFLLPYIKQGVEVAAKEKMSRRTPGLLLPLLRNYPDLPNRKNYALMLGDVLYGLDKKEASDIIYGDLTTRYPNDTEVIQRSQRVTAKAQQSNDYLIDLYDQILVNPDEYGLNKMAALTYVNAVEAKALVSPDAPGVAGHLYAAAEIARSLRTFPKAMSLYDWVIDSYPTDTTHAPNALFIKGYSLEQDFKNDNAAREAYTDFLAKYPNHKMAGSATFLLNNLGKSDEEILAEIEKLKKESKS